MAPSTHDSTRPDAPDPYAERTTDPYAETKAPAPSTVGEVAVRYSAPGDELQRLVERAREGVSVDAFFDLARVTGLTRDELAGLLGVSYKTIQRYEADSRILGAALSEHLFRLIRTFHAGERVFGGQKAFGNWLRKPSAGLTGLVPFECLQTPAGVDLVLEELLRIAHGVVS